MRDDSYTKGFAGAAVAASDFGVSEKRSTAREYNTDIGLLEAAREGDLNARSRIVEENTGLVRSAVKRFLGRGYEAEDLYQIGCMGLLKAVERFDTKFGVRFSTYAVPMIIGEIKRFIRDDGMIKVSRGLKELAMRAASAREILIRENGAEPTVNEIAARLNVSPEELAAALEAGARPESIDAAADNGVRNGQTIADRLECKTDYECEIVNRMLVRELISEFDERERKVIILRYFKQKTQSAIAEILGISQVQVSRTEKRVLERMKAMLTEEKNFRKE